MAEVKKCKIKDCKRPYRAKDYCNVHYKAWRQGEYGKKRYKICGNEGCKKPMFKKGMCEQHYGAWHASKKGGETAGAAPAAAAAGTPPAAPAAPAEGAPPAS